jgi:hypothetical protein
MSFPLPLVAELGDPLGAEGVLADPTRFHRYRRSCRDLQLISIHELIHELLPTDASAAQWITCGAH